MRSYSSCLISRLRSYRKLSLLIVMSLTLLLAYLGLIFLSPEFWGISSLPCLASPVLRWAVQKTPMVLAALCCSIPGITFSLARTNCFLLSPGKPKAKPPMRSKAAYLWLVLWCNGYAMASELFKKAVMWKNWRIRSSIVTAWFWFRHLPDWARRIGIVKHVHYSVACHAVRPKRISLVQPLNLLPFRYRMCSVRCSLILHIPLKNCGLMVVPAAMTC